MYEGWQLVALLNSEFILHNSFAWGLDLSGTLTGAGGVGGLLIFNVHTAPTSSHFYAYDGNGNVAALVSAADGTESARYEYEPFGQLLRATGPMSFTNPFRFSTKRHHDHTELLLYEYRVYGMRNGQWLSRDPIEERGGINVYNFANNNFANNIDALGLRIIQGFIQTPYGLQFYSYDEYDAYYLGVDNAVMGASVDRLYINSGAIPWSKIPIQSLDGRSLEMVFGPELGGMMGGIAMLFVQTAFSPIAGCSAVAEDARELGRMSVEERNGWLMLAQGCKLTSDTYSTALIVAPAMAVGARNMPNMRTMLEPGFEWVGNLPLRRTQPGVPLSTGTRIQRLFLTPTRYPSLNSKTCYMGKMLRCIAPERNWQQGHVFIQQKWFKDGSPAQWYPNNQAANFGMQRLGNAGINLVPMPAALNNSLGRSPVGTAAFGTATATGSIVIVGGSVYLIYQSSQ